MADRGEISTGFKKATADAEWQRLKKFFSQFMPEGRDEPQIASEGRGDLAGEIADVSRMVQEPESDSTDWTGMGTDFMESGDLEDASDDELEMILNELLGQGGGDRESMIEDLTRYRDRMYSR